MEFPAGDNNNFPSSSNYNPQKYYQKNQKGNNRRRDTRFLNQKTLKPNYYINNRAPVSQRKYKR